MRDHLGQYKVLLLRLPQMAFLSRLFPVVVKRRTGQNQDNGEDARQHECNTPVGIHRLFPSFGERVVGRALRLPDQKKKDEIDRCNHRGGGVQDERLFHSQSPLPDDDPEKNGERENACQKIKGEKAHRAAGSVFASLTAMPRKTDVITSPIKKVSHGLAPAAPGTKIPTTREAKMIFAPSRKKSASAFASSFDNIWQQFYSVRFFCQTKTRRQ